MDAHVIVATKGRAPQVTVLVRALSRQTLAPKRIIIVGVGEDDVDRAAMIDHPTVHVVLSGKPGLSVQRNLGVTYLLAQLELARQAAPHASTIDNPWFVVFFDDDFRPAADWLENCGQAFSTRPQAVGLTGRVVADGAQGKSLTEQEAEAYLSGDKPAQNQWANATVESETSCAYGCNMAFRETVLARCRFDENLPLYAWQEDQDYSSQARAYGSMIRWPHCKGVHLGTDSGRVSGLRFGYSQIANPLYLMKKGTMRVAKGSWFVLKAPLVNTLKSLLRSERADYGGRLWGNGLAVFDLLKQRCHPRRIMELG